MKRHLKYIAVLITVLIIPGCSGKEQSTDTIKFLDMVQSKDAEEGKEKDNLDSGKEMEKTAEDIENDDYVVSDDGEARVSEEYPGEPVMVSNTIKAGYFESAKQKREETRAKNKETLMEIINNKDIASADKKSAIRQVTNITKISEKENAAELMLKAKGFQNVVVSINDNNADVVVDSYGLTEQQIAQLEDIVRRKTGIEADKIVITPVKIEGNN